ncbi:MAG TPA: hypothetical protein VL860_13370 [Planctomycetota bacterium]|nr:hypothetical protein [Planctomycetota bacterium]
MIHGKSRTALAAGILGLSCLLLVTGCGDAPSQSVNLSTTTMVFRDCHDPQNIYTVVVTDHQAVLIIEAAPAGQGKTTGTRSLYAHDKIGEDVFRLCLQLSGYSGDAEAPVPPQLPAGFDRALFTHAPVGGHESPPELAAFTPQHRCGSVLNKVRASLERPPQAVKVLPNWIYASEGLVARLGLK